MVDELKKLADSDIKKAYVAFLWMHFNIEYNVEGYFSKNYGDSSPEGVFKSKKAVCEGYSGLYKMILEGLKIECIKISGYSKGYGYKIG